RCPADSLKETVMKHGRIVGTNGIGKVAHFEQQCFACAGRAHGRSATLAGPAAVGPSSWRRSGDDRPGNLAAAAFGRAAGAQCANWGRDGSAARAAPWGGE